jgi:hypothetical protein
MRARQKQVSVACQNHFPDKYIASRIESACNRHSELQIHTLLSDMHINLKRSKNVRLYLITRVMVLSNIVVVSSSKPGRANTYIIVLTRITCVNVIVVILSLQGQSISFTLFYVYVMIFFIITAIKISVVILDI